MNTYSVSRLALALAFGVTLSAQKNWVGIMHAGFGRPYGRLL